MISINTYYRYMNKHLMHEKKISKFLPFNYQDRKIIDLYIFNIQINDYYESQSTENKKHIFLKMNSINELCK